MFSTIYSEITTFLTMFPTIQPIDEELPIPKRRKKCVRFTEINMHYSVPSIKAKDNPNLWWNKKEITKTLELLESQFITFMEIYNDNRLNLHLKPITRSIARTLFFTKVIIT